jgi:hypothetical protein
MSTPKKKQVVYEPGNLFDSAKAIAQIIRPFGRETGLMAIRWALESDGYGNGIRIQRGTVPHD